MRQILALCNVGFHKDSGISAVDTGLHSRYIMRWAQYRRSGSNDRDAAMGLSWGIVFGVTVIMVGCAALSFIITVKQLKKEQRG